MHYSLPHCQPGSEDAFEHTPEYGSIFLPKYPVVPEQSLDFFKVYPVTSLKTRGYRRVHGLVGQARGTGTP